MHYVVSAIAAAVTSVQNRKKQDEGIKQLGLLFWGGAVYGVVDHLWNGELFLVSAHPIKDMLLGFTITGCLFLSWLVVRHLESRKVPREGSYCGYQLS